MTNTLKIGIYGSVDAGKTSLIQSLLKSKIKKYCHEEIKSITTVLGSTSFNIGLKNLKYHLNQGSNVKKFCIIDTPGHMSYRHKSHSSIYFTDHAILLIEILNSHSVAEAIKFSKIFNAYGIKYSILITKIDNHEKSQILKFKQSVKKSMSGYDKILYYTTQSPLARENLLEFLYFVDSGPRVSLKNIFAVLKSYNPNRVGSKIVDMNGAVVGGIGQNLSVGDNVIIHDLPAIDSPARNLIQSKIVKILKNGLPVKEIRDMAFHTIELSTCPDIGSQDGLAGCIISKKKYQPTNILNISIIQQYGNLKKKMQVYLLYRGAMIKSQLICTGKKKATLKLSRPIYLTGGDCQYLLYPDISTDTLAVAKNDSKTQ